MKRKTLNRSFRSPPLRKTKHRATFSTAITMPPSPVVLSEDLIIEILSLLPVKSLVRFRCASKYWKTLISEPTFVKLHLQKSQSLYTLNMKHKNHIRGDYYWEEVHRLVRYPINHIFENPSFTLVHDSHSPHLKIGKSFLIVGSCNGLVLLFHKSNLKYNRPRNYCFLVWNPATSTSSEFFGHFCDPETFRFAFGCDNSTGTYKVVAFCFRSQTIEVRVLNLDHGHYVWRNIETFPVVPYRGSISQKSDVYLSSTLNWLSIHNEEFCYHLKDTTVEHFFIVSLDLETETYNQYTVPRGFDEVPCPINPPTIGVLGGCLCFSYFYRETDFVVWQMKKFGIEDSWTQLLKISYHVLAFRHRARSTFQLAPLFLSEDGDSLILEMIFDGFLEPQTILTILYNRRDNIAKRTEIIASRTTVDNRTTNNVYRNHANDYLESLVPIP